MQVDEAFSADKHTMHCTVNSSDVSLLATLSPMVRPPHSGAAAASVTPRRRGT